MIPSAPLSGSKVLYPTSGDLEGISIFEDKKRVNAAPKKG